MISGKKRGPRKEQRILKDHKKIGKKFVPPLAQLGLTDVYWVNDILPELFWMALLNERHGLAHGAKLCVELAKAAMATKRGRRKPWFGTMSSYVKLTDNQKRRIVVAVEDLGLLQDLRAGLKPLVQCYPECPLSFLFGNSLPKGPRTVADLEFIKGTLESLFDRRGEAATWCQANAIYIAFVTDKLKVAKGLALADFPEIQDFPNTDKSRLIASAVRAMVTGFFGEGLRDEKAGWSKYFWNRGLELENCYFPRRE